jgi:hypothetical protein
MPTYLSARNLNVGCGAFRLVDGNDDVVTLLKRCRWTFICAIRKKEMLSQKREEKNQ